MIYDIADYIQGRAPRGASVACPFHDDTTASAMVMPDSGRFYCFRCCLGGDQIGIAKRVWFPDLPWGLGIQMAETLIKQEKYPIITVDLGEDEIPLPTEDPRLVATMTAFCRVAAQELAGRADLRGELLTKRAIHNPIRLGLGFATHGVFHQFMRQQLREDPYWEREGEDLMVRTGIVSKPGDVIRSIDQRFRLHDRWIIPEVRTDQPRGARVIYYQARSKLKDHKFRYLNPTLPRPLFGVESLDRLKDFVWLVEGPFDMLPLIEAGEAAISCNGLSFNPRILEELLPRIGDRPMAVAFDNDPTDAHGYSPGLAEGAKRVAKLEAAGITAIQIVPPDPYKDVSEWIVGQGVDAVVSDVTWRM